MSMAVKAAEWVKQEVLDILPVTVFFLIWLHMITFSKHLILRQEGILYDGFWAATIGALLIAKVVLIVDKLSLMQLFHGRPLYRPILYRAVIYTVGVFIFRLLELIIRKAVQTGGVASGVDAAFAEIVWAQFVFVELWIFMLFLVYVTFVELHKTLGETGLTRVLFSREGA